MQMKTPKSQLLYQQALDHFNEPVICCGRLARLVGYAEDEMDCYFIMESKHFHMPKWYQTCVGGYTFLDCLRGANQVTAHNGEIWDDITRLQCDLPPEYDKFELDLEA
jgi:hypothetical protein